MTENKSTFRPDRFTATKEDVKIITPKKEEKK
ncbi:hypothetical protein FHS14_003470 [Paenibacillus baekrokdamisoli]|nr:hypothetical protein [Paenibacillus baekrokdamisoli]